MIFDTDYQAIGSVKYCIYCGEETETEFFVEMGSPRHIPICSCRGARIKYEIEKLETEQRHLVKKAEIKLERASVLELAERVAKEKERLGLD